MKIVEITDWHVWGPRVAALERGVSYPLGADRFEIDHGPDYSAFFRRLGELHYVAAIDGERVAAVAAGAIRSLPGGRAWYLGDLKVHPDYRGRRLAWAMVRWGFPRHYWRCRRGYAITMDPPDRPNRVVRLSSHFWLIRNGVAARLLFWSLDRDAARAVSPVVRRHRGPLTWRSLAGIKDLVLASTGRPMPLLHAQFGPCAEHGQDAPDAGATHMLCAPDGDALAAAMAAEGLAPSATATLLAHRMPRTDWSFVLTSDI
ncbi:MAG: GNAT family N-acetyltransferase [Myxococcota bacterium]